MNAPWSSQQQLNSFLASITNGLPTRTSNAGNPTATLSSSVETFESVSAGQTVTRTVTHAATQSSQPTSDESLTTTRSGGNSTNVGAIAGGTVGGLVVLASALFLLVLLRRRKRIKEQRRATLPPPYPGGDMSEQLTGTLGRRRFILRLTSHRYHTHYPFRRKGYQAQ
jgi:hypothetical protein